MALLFSYIFLILYPKGKSFEEISSNLFKDMKLIFKRKRSHEDSVKKITSEENKRRTS